MKKLKRHPPSPTADLRQLDADSKYLCPDTLVKLKNARLRRLKIQRLKLKYTCEAKIYVAPVDRQEEGTEFAELENKDRNIDESMRISLSLTTSSKEDDRSTLAPNNDVLDAFRSEKYREDGFDAEDLSYGSVSLIGRRKEMEDAVSVEVGFVAKERIKCDFFAVYDGHGGAQVARACRERLYRLVAEELERRGRNGGEVDWEGMMEGCFGKMDKEFADNAAVRTVGSTAVVAVVAKDEVVVANCGDCRAVMGRGGEAVALSDDHKPDRPDELMRIEAAGGRVINWNGQRVLGVLATSRSIGDQYLRPYVISKPEVTVTKRTNEDEFLILASDGLWDVISSEAACEVVRKCLSGQARRNSPELENQSLASEAAALLAELAMAKGSGDNTSVIVVELSNHNKFTSPWCQIN
ncbi:protein phosphatase 2C 51-like [Prosopis cineraria]|uniref:protein phosphatase 2C 51-like n=1 Tax=Prosopis cineraria TaxID=364024 RepID=UPI00240F50C8|nr:protein phosphatase 2C 51-like [Prosopis cineraria]